MPNALKFMSVYVCHALPLPQLVLCIGRVAMLAFWVVASSELEKQLNLEPPSEGTHMAVVTKK